ncbi:MAG TPA: hypothetical protein VLY03_08045 [Bacteroidota bacterium]|nr:hypothetical protein [Bacteroidota bacterium]
MEPANTVTTGTSSQSLCRIGFWSALVAFVGASGYCVVQILQVLTILGPPWDGILIFGLSLCIATPFVIAMLALHYLTPEVNRFWSHAAVLLAVVYAVYVNLNYVVQLTTVIPRSLNGSLDELRVLDQTPHSLFWDVDALGYIFMGLSTLFAVPLFAKSGFEKWPRRFFLANGLILPLICFVYFYPSFSIAALLLGLPWVITAPGSILVLAIFFRRRLRTSTE